MKVSTDFKFGEEIFPSGKYVIYAFPRKGEMEIRLNSDLRFWGYTEPDYSQDLATVLVPVSPNEHVEQFTIEAVEASSGVTFLFTWGNYKWELPLEKS